MHLNFLNPLGLSDMSTQLVQPFKCLPTDLAEVDPPGGALPRVIDHVPLIRGPSRCCTARKTHRGFWLVWVSLRLSGLAWVQSLYTGQCTVLMVHVRMAFWVNAQLQNLQTHDL